MEDGSHLSGTGFHGGFPEKLLLDQPNMQELNNFNFSDDLSFGFPFEAAVPIQDLLFAAAAHEVKDEPKRRRSGSQIDNPRERKKQIDKRYRDRVKTEKERMKQQLDEVKEEKGSLIKEIEHLRGENATMNQTLESSAEHMRAVTTSHNQLKRDFTRQQSFLEALLSKLSPESDMIIMAQNQQTEMLRLKEAIIRRDMAEVDHLFEELLSENRELKKENKILGVKVEALCEKIHNDKHQR